MIRRPPESTRTDTLLPDPTLFRSKAGKMPSYVTESGYEEFEEVRTRVGHEPPLPQKIWLVDVANAGVRELKYDTLPGIADDPLADLRKAAGKQPLEGNRAVRIEKIGRAHV